MEEIVKIFNKINSAISVIFVTLNAVFRNRMGIICRISYSQYIRLCSRRL